MRKNSEASLLTVEGNRLIIRPLNRIHPRPAAEMKYPLRIVPQDLRLHQLSVNLASDTASGTFPRDFVVEAPASPGKGIFFEPRARGSVL
jgi:hypothetical protein